MIDDETQQPERERAIVRAGQAWTDERTDEMRALPEQVRRDAINAAPNCLGYDRFQQRRRQVELRDGYRKPPTPGPGGHA